MLGVVLEGCFVGEWQVGGWCRVFKCAFFSVCTASLYPLPAVPAVPQGLMRKRVASINEAPITEGQRRIAVPNPVYNTWLADQVGACSAAGAGWEWAHRDLALWQQDWRWCRSAALAALLQRAGHRRPLPSRRR